MKMERDLQSGFGIGIGDSSVFTECASLNNLMPLPPSDFCYESYCSFPVVHSSSLSPQQLTCSSPWFAHEYDESTTKTQLLDLFSESCNNFQSFNLNQSPAVVSHESPQKRRRLIQQGDADQGHVQSHREMARQRRMKIGDKIRRLQKLMPWDKKMDTATMLEEAKKYVKFLEAQVRALDSMPVQSKFAVVRKEMNMSGFGSVGMLNRQQMLEVLANSPLVQTQLYSQGVCVFSLEQYLVLVNKFGQTNFLLQQ